MVNALPETPPNAERPVPSVILLPLMAWYLGRRRKGKVARDAK